MNIPEFPHGATDNQQIMYMLAEGTGGFVINNTNDMAGGMQKIGKEQNQYYIVGYTPPESAEGSCHTLKVKVDKGGTTVRSRAGLLQREIARRAGGQSDREDAGEQGDGDGGGHDRGVDAGAVLLHGGEHGARGGGDRDSVGRDQV